MSLKVCKPASSSGNPAGMLTALSCGKVTHYPGKCSGFSKSPQNYRLVHRVGVCKMGEGVKRCQPPVIKKKEVLRCNV